MSGTSFLLAISSRADIKMLDALQRELGAVYGLGHGYDVRDFLITDQAYAKILGQGTVSDDSEETLLMRQEGDDFSISLFLDAELLRRLEDDNPLDALRPETLDDLCKVIEGVSHFSCVAWKTTKDRTLSLLELEIQGEIDKFVATMRLAIAQTDESMLRNLHRYLFEDIRFKEGLDSSQLQRYRQANDIAARYCYQLRQQLLNKDDSVLHELRHFYRLQLNDKISHIRA